MRHRLNLCMRKVNYPCSQESRIMKEFENNEKKESDINLEDFPFICRICLKKSDTRLFKVEDSLIDVFLTITKIDVRSTASLPENICHDCIKTLEDISLFIDISKYNDTKLGKNSKPKIKDEHVETAERGTSLEHVIKIEETVEECNEDLQYFKEFEICRICYSTKILKPVEEKAHLMQLFQNITNIDANAEIIFSKRNSICNKCINKLETISLFISTSLSNEIKLKEIIGRNEALETEKYLEGNADDLGYWNKVKGDDDFDKNAHSYDSNSLHTIDNIKEEIVDIIKEEIVDTPDTSFEQINQNGIKYFGESHSENAFESGPCRDKFSTETHLENQLLDISLEIQLETNLFKCNGCDKSFSKKHSLKSHLFTHTGEKPFKCNCCEDSFSLKLSLKRHLLTHTGIKSFICDCCKKSFTHKHSLKKHLLTHTGEKPFKCDGCEKRFPHKQGLKAHSLIHAAEKPFKCDYCEKRVTSKSSLRQHVLIHVGKKAFKCDSCEKRFTNKSNLQQHILIHSGEKPFKCDYCEKRFTWKVNLKQHLLIHSGEKPFECDCCGRNFTQKVSLQQHMLIHSGEKPFECDYCEKSFAYKISLKGHLLTHTDTFKCVYCEKSFINQHSLNSHLLNHTGEKPFKCYCCKKCFNRKGSLQQHMLTHSFEKQFECNRCNKIFTQKGNLQKHLLVHEKYQR